MFGFLNETPDYLILLTILYLFFQTGVVALVIGSKPIQPSKLIIARQVDIFTLDCSGIDPAPVIVNSGRKWSFCYPL